MRAIRGGDPVDGQAGGLQAGLEGFLAALRAEEGLATNTLRSYRSDLVPFLAWIGERGRNSPTSIQAADVVDYLSRRSREGISQATLAHNLTSIRMLMRYLVAEGEIQRDPTALLPGPALRRILPGTLSVDQVERLLSAPDRPTWSDARDRALLEMLYATGARVSEAIALRSDDLDSHLAIARLRGKGGRERNVPLGARDLPSASRPTRCAIPSQRTSSRAERTCARCRRCSDTPRSRRPRSTRTSTRNTSAGCTGCTTRVLDADLGPDGYQGTGLPR
jgi:site-specific recombinase XerC